MTSEEREKKTRIANMLIGTIKDLRTPMLMYQVEKDVAKEALESYIKMLKQQPKTTGHWIKYQEPWGGMQGWKCSNCKNHYDVSSVYTIIPYNYCPNCGSAMTEE